MCIDIYTPGTSDYTWPKDLRAKFGELTEHNSDEAKRYIRTVTEIYPFQMRFYLGEPMWARFCDAWAESGDITRAMRAV